MIYQKTDVMIDDKYEYFAFISYKEEDSEWARWLQRMLENYKLPEALLKEHPELPVSIRPIYEYKSEAGGGRLKEVIWKGLTRSKYLIVICSPRAIQSKWLNDGIRYFIESGQEENIIPFIVEGNPKSSNSEEECFPSALLELKGERELRGININEMGRDAAAVKVVSQMFDLKFDNLWQRWEREQKKERRRKIGFILGVVSIIAIVSIIFVYKLNNINSQLVDKNRQLGEAQDSLGKINRSLLSAKDSLEKINISLSLAYDSIQKINIELNVTNINLSLANNKVNELNDTIKIKNEIIMSFGFKNNENRQGMQKQMKELEKSLKQNPFTAAEARLTQLNMELNEMDDQLEKEINN